MKFLSNEDKIKNLIKRFNNESPMGLAITVTFLKDKADQVLANQDQLKEELKNSMVSPDSLIWAAEIIKEELARTTKGGKR